MEDRLIQVDYEEEIQKSYIDYAMSVIAQRALPDVRDGLKPVHRRILYAMYELGLMPDKPFRKSARIVGDVLGKYHPHGDSAVYETMVRMAQDFRMPIPLIEGHGNFGSIDGDNPAAMRYTEARLSKASLELLKDLEYKTVDFTDNFDNTLKEPTVLPSRFPQLLVNGVNGIAVGMTTNIPPHNLSEVIDGVIAYMKNPNISVKQLMRYIKGPDFPTGGIIVNKEELLSIYEKGTGKNGLGKIRVRARVLIENAGQGKTNIVITEIPFSYAGNKTKFIEHFISLMRERKLEEISDVRDESSKEGIRIVLEVKRGVNIDNLLNKLYKKTPLEDSISVIFLALVNQRPEVLNLKDLIRHFVEFQKEIVKKKYQYLLEKAEEKQEVLEGLIKATEQIDVIIEVLRGSQDTKMVRNCLINGVTDGISFKTKKAEKEAKKFRFTERQADSILDMRLQKLIQLEVSKLEKEFQDICQSIQKYRSILHHEEELLAVIQEDLREIQQRYKQKRKTEIQQVETAEYTEEIVEEELGILVDRFGYIKAVDIASMKRNEEKQKDFAFSLIGKNTEKLGLFTNKGKYYLVKVQDIPKGKWKDKGIPIENIAKMKDEKLVFIERATECLNHSLLFISKKGMIKVVEGKEFDVSRSGVLAFRLEEDDELVSVLPIGRIDNSSTFVAIITKNSYALRFPLQEVPIQKKNAKGVKGISLKEGDEVRAVYVFQMDNGMITENEQEIDIEKIPIRKRGRSGQKL